MPELLEPSDELSDGLSVSKLRVYSIHESSIPPRESMSRAKVSKISLALLSINFVGVTSQLEEQKGTL